MPDLEARPCPVSPPPDLRLDDPDSVGYLERSLASSPLWQMGGSKVLRRELVRRDPRLLDFLASAKKAPLGELEFDVLTWTITRWYQTGRPTDGRVRATFGDIAHALYGRRKGGKQYVDVREALDHLYNVSLDLTILSIEHDTERWQTRRRRRIIQELNIREELVSGTERDANTIELQLSSWLVDQLDAYTVSAIAWQVLRRLSGIAKRLAIYLVAHGADFEPITRHTERFTVELTDELYEELGVTAARERQRRLSVARAADRIAEQDQRYTRLAVESAGGPYVLRAERPIGGDVLLLPARPA